MGPRYKIQNDTYMYNAHDALSTISSTLHIYIDASAAALPLTSVLYCF